MKTMVLENPRVELNVMPRLSVAGLRRDRHSPAFAIASRPEVVFVTQFRKRLVVEDLQPTGPSKAVASGARFAGVGIEAIPLMVNLGVRVHLGGRMTPDQRPLRDIMVDRGVNFAMRPVRGRSDQEIFLPGDRSVHIPGGSDCSLADHDAELLATANPTTLVMDAGLKPDYTAFMLDAAAARNLPTFLITTNSGSLRRFDMGKVHHLINLAPFLESGDVPSRKVLQLHQQSGAATTFAQHPQFGLFVAEGFGTDIYHLPLMGAEQSGNQDASWGALIGVYLQSPLEYRIERALQAARLCAARKAMGKPAISGWCGLNNERANSRMPALNIISQYCLMIYQNESKFSGNERSRVDLYMTR
jgi:hypothetical protein